MDHEFAAGLKALAEAAFPKRCRNCGQTFATARDFVQDTNPLRTAGSGLKQAQDDDLATIVELYLNCPCGSTLMDFFSDRRDLSAAGEKRRVLFNTLLPHLQQKGLTPADARAHLLRLLRGEAPE